MQSSKVGAAATQVRAVLDARVAVCNRGDVSGTVAFSDLEITVLSSDAALVLGRWQLERANDRPSGVFTLVFRKLPEGWRIVHDHTTVVSRSHAARSTALGNFRLTTKN